METPVSDRLMDVFGVTAQMKRENPQYWGRELGTIWEALVRSIALPLPGYGPAVRIGADEPCDFVFSGQAIDTKYRFGSGDSGTLKKLRANAELLQERGYSPVLLILREDNLKEAISSLARAGWTVAQGPDAFVWVQSHLGVDLEAQLAQLAGAYKAC